MHTRFDQFGKQLIRAALNGCGSVETEAEVPAHTRWVDLWFTPDAGGGRIPDYLGWLGRMLDRPSTLEFFHNSVP